jgi:hypothetical protein
MKNLSDISKTMCDCAGAQDMTAATGDLKLHSGVNFLGMDIDDAATLVWYCLLTLNFTLNNSSHQKSAVLADFLLQSIGRLSLVHYYVSKLFLYHIFDSDSYINFSFHFSLCYSLRRTRLLTSTSTILDFLHLYSKASLKSSIQGD